MNSQSRPIDTSSVSLPVDILALAERLAEHVHDVYVRNRLAQGWRFGPFRDDVARENPTLVPYDELSESEKDIDRQTTLETLKAIIALGYRLERR